VVHFLELELGCLEARHGPPASKRLDVIAQGLDLGVVLLDKMTEASGWGTGNGRERKEWGNARAVASVLGISEHHRYPCTTHSGSFSVRAAVLRHHKPGSSHTKSLKHFRAASHPATAVQPTVSVRTINSQPSRISPGTFGFHALVHRHTLMTKNTRHHRKELNTTRQLTIAKTSTQGRSLRRCAHKKHEG